VVVFHFAVGSETSGGVEQMDPNATLNLLRDLVSENATLAHDETRKVEIADELAQAIEAMDNWLCTGGFLPDTWNRKVLTTRSV